MNPSSILSIKSIRFKNLHIDPETGNTRDLGGVNKAKRESRALGGAKHVRAFSRADEKNEFLKLWREEHAKENPPKPLTTQETEFQQAASSDTP